MDQPISVDRCRYRSRARIEGDAEVADCRLLGEIAGVADEALCVVARDACEYCLRTGEPSVHRINPVLGSLLHGLASQVVARGGVEGCDADKAGRLRRWAEEFLDTEPSQVDAPYFPERVTTPCHYLGEPAGARVRQSDGILAREPVFRCHHPAHAETTRDECLRCRDWSAGPRTDLGVAEAWLPASSVRAGGPVRKWAVGVTTSPRRRPTLEWTLDSLARAGWDEARLFVDAAVTIPRRYAHYPVTYREPKTGAWPNFYLALAELLMRDPDADAYFMVQDDVEFYDRINLREFLESCFWPSDPPGPVSLYSCQLDARPESGWHPHEFPWFRGAHAFVFPPETVRQFLVDPVVFGHRWNPRGDGDRHVDTVVGEWGYRTGNPVRLPTPSLCRHVGHASTISPLARIEHDRKEGAFAGEAPPPRLDVPAAGVEFPESAFPCPEALAEAYARTVERGRARMRERSATICGIGRDVARALPAFAARVERLGGMFRAYHAVFYENDSADATPALLEDWARANPAVRVVSERLGLPRFGLVRSLERARLLAEYRNRCRELVLAEFGDDDHVIVVDMDLEGGWSDDGISHTFGHDDWDFVGSSGLVPGPADPRDGRRRPVQYDIWAYREPGHEDPRPIPEVQHLPLRRGDPLRPVWSCFGGLGIYRMECVRAAAYGGDDCEHVVLHRALRASGYDRLYLNPSQIVLYKGGV